MAANSHNVNTCLRRLRAAIESRQGDWGTLIADEVISIGQENPHGVIDGSYSCVAESVNALVSAGLLNIAADKQHAIVRMSGEY